MPEDSEVLRRIARGDQAAFCCLVDRYARYLYSVAYGLSGNWADAEDLVQETFAAVLNGRFRGESSVRTWLVGILIRQAAMWRRSKRRRERVLSWERCFRVREEPEPSPELLGAEARIDLGQMLQELSPEHREIIVLRELEGLSYGEIAKTLSIPPGTVESRLHRAREDLRRRFKGYL